MKSHESNGHPAGGQPERDPAGALDPLAEAEALRATLADAAQQASRLVMTLRGRKKEQKALASVYSSLKSLNLGP